MILFNDCKIKSIKILYEFSGKNDLVFECFCFYWV